MDQSLGNRQVDLTIWDKQISNGRDVKGRLLFTYQAPNTLAIFETPSSFLNSISQFWQPSFAHHFFLFAS
jgi:hypothetical protein